VPARPFDLVVNATSAGLSDALPALAAAAVGPGTACYDLSYGDRPTPFQRLALALGAAAALDGIGMLVEQAACAFEIWHGVYPQTTPVIAEIRAGLTAT
jgi:shikimate dehydrogenase